VAAEYLDLRRAPQYEASPAAGPISDIRRSG